MICAKKYENIFKSNNVKQKTLQTLFFKTVYNYCTDLLYSADIIITLTRRALEQPECMKSSFNPISKM